MFKKDTVLVLGAAVSHEVGMPLGADLKSNILDVLPSQQAGDDFVRSALFLQQDMRLNGAACTKIRVALPKAASIDNLIEHRGSDLAFRHCAKVGIFAAIVKAEARCSVYRKPGQALGSVGPAACTYEALFRLVVGNASVDKLEDAVRRVRIINFNYDRCLEHFFHDWLMGYSGLEPGEAWRIVDALHVVRPYGSIGTLPRVGGTDATAVPFGANLEGLDLNALAENILTFSEERAAHIDDQVKAIMASSVQLIFLGCAFHPQNIRLLRPQVASWKWVFGTSYLVPPLDGLSTPSLESFSAPTGKAFSEAVESWPATKPQVEAVRRKPCFEPLTCLQLTTKYAVEWAEPA
jgi:hypothetical protein